MPTILELKRCLEPIEVEIPDVFFLVAEREFPYEAVELLKQRLINYVKLEHGNNREDIIKIAELTIAEYGGTILPFVLYRITY